MLEVIVDEEDQSTLVVVPDYQLSLAIGKRGQNARLAAKLTGWKIDIKSETDAREAGLYPVEDPEADTLTNKLENEDEESETATAIVDEDVELEADVNEADEQPETEDEVDTEAVIQDDVDSSDDSEPAEATETDSETEE